MTYNASGSVYAHINSIHFVCNKITATIFLCFVKFYSLTVCMTKYYLKIVFNSTMFWDIWFLWKLLYWQKCKHSYIYIKYTICNLFIIIFKHWSSKILNYYNCYYCSLCICTHAWQTWQKLFMIFLITVYMVENLWQLIFSAYVNI